MTHQGFLVFSGGAGGLSKAQRAKLRLVYFSYRDKEKQEELAGGAGEDPSFAPSQTQVQILTYLF